MNDLPPGWATARLEDVAEIILGQSPPGRSYNTLGQGLPFFQGKAEFGKLHPKIRKWTTEPKKLAVRGDILLSVRAPVGPTNIAPTTCAIGRGLHAIRPVDAMNRDFVLWNLRSSIDRLIRSSTGSTFGAVTGHQVRTHEIQIAPASEQQRIVERIEEVFTGLETAESTLKSLFDRLKILRSTILAAAFHTDVDLPPRWTMSTIGELCKINPRFTKKSFSDEQLLTFIPMSAVEAETCRADVSEVRTMGELRRRSYRGFRDGDILVAKITPSMENGKVAVAQDLVDGWGMGSTEFHILRPHTGVEPRYIAWFTLQKSFRAQARMNMTGTAGQLRVPARFLETAPIPLPPVQAQRRIVEAIEKSLNQVYVIERSTQRVVHRIGMLRRSVLSEALAGRLVPQDPDDEPASELLEHIVGSHPAKPKRRRKTSS